MSLNLDMTAKVWLSALPKGINKLVLLCFCQHLNDTSALSWPSISRVARMCGMSERTVQCHVRALQRAGILHAQLRTGRTTRYAINLSALAPLQFDAPTACTDLFTPVDNLAADVATPAVFAAESAQTCTPPPQLTAPTPAIPAPITVFNSKENIKGTGAPALPATLMMIDGVSPEILKDFAAVRQSKRAAPLTATAIDSLRTEAALAGLSVEAALVTCIKRGWARFEAAWLLDGRSTPALHLVATTTAPAKPASAPPAPAKLAAPEVAAAGRQRLSLIRQTPPVPVVGIQIGNTGPGWAHAIVNKHQSGQRVSHASLREACTALKTTPASLARLH